MEPYIPSYEITNKILGHVSSISEKIGQITERHNLDNRPHLKRNNKIKSIYSSLRIEENSLSLSEVKDVIDGRMVLGTAREVQEVKNAYAAYDEIIAIDPYRIEELKRIHGIMMQYLVDEAGVFRLGEEGVFYGDTCIFMAPPAKFVPGQMESLFTWMNENRNRVHPLILSAVFHYEFVFIHPFADGNGRMARLWHTVLLSKWKPIFEYIPIESQVEKFQDGYYRTIADCHKDGSSSRFIEFMLEQIDSILDEVLSQSRKAGETESRYVKKLLEVMEYDIPYTANEILDLLGLKSKETLRKNYLNPALESSCVVMTIPDKPNSRNQRYVRR